MTCSESASAFVHGTMRSVEDMLLSPHGGERQRDTRTPTARLLAAGVLVLDRATNERWLSGLADPSSASC